MPLTLPTLNPPLPVPVVAPLRRQGLTCATMLHRVAQLCTSLPLPLPAHAPLLYFAGALPSRKSRQLRCSSWRSRHSRCWLHTRRSHLTEGAPRLARWRALRCCVQRAAPSVAVPPPSRHGPHVTCGVPSLFTFTGDSHSLSPAWRSLRWRGGRHLLRPVLVTGLKTWHLRPSSDFYPKANFEAAMKTIPDGAPVVCAPPPPPPQSLAILSARV